MTDQLAQFRELDPKGYEKLLSAHPELFGDQTASGRKIVRPRPWGNIDLCAGVKIATLTEYGQYKWVRNKRKFDTKSQIIVGDLKKTIDSYEEAITEAINFCFQNKNNDGVPDSAVVVKSKNQYQVWSVSAKADKTHYIICLDRILYFGSREKIKEHARRKKLKPWKSYIPALEVNTNSISDLHPSFEKATFVHGDIIAELDTNSEIVMRQEDFA